LTSQSVERMSITTCIRGNGTEKSLGSPAPREQFPSPQTIWILKFLVYFFYWILSLWQKAVFSEICSLLLFSRDARGLPSWGGGGCGRTVYLCNRFISYFVDWKSTAFHNPAGGGWPSFLETL